MANYTSTANIVLSINGKQAQQMLAKLQKEASSLERRIAKAATAGDKATMKKLQRELTSTNKIIQQLQGSAKTTEQVLSRLDRATPKELNKALRTLTQQLNGIERGTKAWNAHVAKIRAVKAEIAKLNASLATQKSLWERMNGWLNNCQTAILGLTAAITGLIMAGRKAVNTFAEMEEQLANTRKYTGLSVEEVNRLNEAFKRMDTRTPREKLNELAQEAGRLGLNTLEAVQGYVEAADIINVALVDLGEGATQTIAKLTNIFGVEDLLGTKDAMLAVGSTVNVLSQNCTASKPYLVEFAQRMAGIGSQAGLTIPQILAFGAVLDANGQKVEMSATAIQKVIMNLANKNQEFAKTLGLDAELLNSTLKRSAKDGLMMFLQALHDIGESSDYENATMILAPAFKDMGLDAARVSQVLSTLAKHIDEVKWQMGEADKAFRSATSATHEYEIFNNTAQAAIDKAKKRVTELAVELGEKLYPIMSHIYTTSGVFLRILNKMVSFFIEHKKAILTLTVTLAAYNIIIGVYNARVAIATKATALWHASINFMKGAVPALRLILSALINVIQYFTNGLEVNYAMQQRWRKSMEAMKLSSWVGMILAIAGAVYMVTSKIKDHNKALEEARKKEEEFKKSIVDLDEASASYCAKEIDRLDALYKEATDEAKSTDERRKAAEKLQKLYPDYFKNLSIEEIMVGKTKDAYDKLRNSIIEVARARAAAGKIEENEKQLLTLEQQAPGLLAAMEAAKGPYDQAVAEYERALQQQRLNDRAAMNSTDAAAMGIVTVTPSASRVAETGRIYETAKAAYEENQRQQRLLNEANEFLRQKYNVSAEALMDPQDPQTPIVPIVPTTTTDTTATDKFAAEKDWRERAEAEARISYATGVTDYLAYTKRMDEIAVDFCEKQLLHTDLTETERLTITANWREAQKKQAEDAVAESVDIENKAYNTRIAEAKQFYIDGKYSKETYDLRIEELEIEHQRNLINLYEEGTKERAEAESRLTDLLISQTQRRQQETEKLEQKYAKMKEEYFGDNPKERQSKYDADLAALQVVYDRELAAAGDNAEEKLRIEEAFQVAKLALQKKYGLLAEEDTRNAMQRSVAASLEWLNGEGGKALTGSIDTLVSGMSAIFSQLSTLMQAELEIQTAAINKRYDAEIARAENNSFQIKQLEEQKQKEIAKAKQEANRKMFAMQVIQAVAQTAQGAISAYASAAAIPVVGWVMAPIAAGLALAAGAIQIAAIKKQQQASEAQGYSEGGFTPDGDKDKPVGIVHAGEWVASQKLTRDPRVRPFLEALDYAQRTNTIGSLTHDAVSYLMPATAGTTQGAILQSPQPNVVVNIPQSGSDNKELAETLSLLRARLNEPFVTVNTVSGDHGIQQAQNEYDRLMKNKSPKSRR